ncbi:hypothetical protein [Bacillus sp. MUM 13]|uniref:hypothetical protein n=1 Tax=Bacillus sp. MUM 13 TaxID=1678001 RepID=UPI0008F5859F|nr:hypothetical protein [Bacillus sp. MUM 13]OIK12836.1 hypothetical protein BIV59_07530 [Bacillus sp. MUM 13]
MIPSIGLVISYLMALYLFYVAYFEAIKISNQEGKVNGTLLIMSAAMAMVFTEFSMVFHSQSFG